MRIFYTPEQAITINDGDDHDLDFMLPIASSVVARISNGYVALVLRTDKGTGSDTTDLTVVATPLYELPVVGLTAADGPASQIVTLVDELDWADGEYYSYPIPRPEGPYSGLRITLTYTNGAGGETMTVTAWLVSE